MDNLIKAVKDDDLDRTRFLIELGMTNADTNILEKDNEGWTSLHWASCYGRLEIVKLLIEFDMSNAKSNFNISEKDIYGWTALHIASYQGHLEIVRFLIEYGMSDAKSDANTNISKKEINGDTALHIASRSGHFEIVKLLVEYYIDTKSDIDVVNNDDETAIDTAKTEEIKEFLIEQLEIQKNSYVLK